MKKIILSLAVLTSLAFAAEETNTKDIYINVDSELGSKLFNSEKSYKKYLEKEDSQNKKIVVLENKIEKNNCEIVRLKKAIVRLIKINSKIVEKDTQKTEVKYINIETLPTLNSLLKEDSKIPHTKEICVTKKKIDTTGIEESYYKYKNTKTFKVVYNKAGEFNYPVIGSHVKGMLHKNDKFKADMFTKAGWVHNINGGWVKGYKLYPKVENKTTTEDIKKWGLKYKTYTECKKEEVK